MAKILLERKKGAFGFDVKDELGHLLQTDSSRENGGDDYGFRPMQLLLAAVQLTWWQSCPNNDRKFRIWS